MKKLIPALCMLLVAACLMGTSTYAWFAANEDVTATGMSVKAAADGGLAIAAWVNNGGTAAEPATNAYKGSWTLDTDTDWVNQLNADHTAMTAPTVKPTSLAVATDGTATWYTGEAAANNAFTALTPTEEGKTKFTAITDGKGYYQHTMWNLVSLDQTDTVYTLKVGAITVADITNPQTPLLNNAIRVALKVTDADDDVSWFVFAPKYASTDTTTALNHVTGTTTSDATTGYTVIKGNGAGTELCEITTDPVTVEVFVYYEGEDTNCKSDNLSLNVDNLVVTVNYTTGD